MHRALLFVALVLLGGLCVPPVGAATFVLADGAYATLSACMAGSAPCVGLANGDTVRIPAGSWSWSSVLTITKAITLQGAGADVTTIVDATDKSLHNDLLLITQPAGTLFRLTGMTIDNLHGAPNSSTSSYGIIYLYGVGTTWRLDHLHILTFKSPAMTILSTGGVIDHCVFDLSGGANGPGIYGFNGRDEAYGGGASVFGDASWADSAHYGSGTIPYFIEDNTFNVPSGQPWVWSHDGWMGERVVFRFNTVNRASFNNHGTETRWRGGRTFEVYANTFDYPVSDAPDAGIGFRSGTGVVWGNAMTTATGQPTSFGHETTPRQDSPFTPWGQCDALNDWDSNDATVYGSGTHTGANAATVLTDTTKTWTTNQWIGYEIHTTVNSETGRVVSNTATTATFATDLAGDPVVVWNTGNAYQIRKPVACLDQAGRGQGDLLTGDTPVNSALGNVAAWPRQVREPIYAWRNTFNGVATPFTSFAPVIAVEGTDFFNETTGNVVVGTTLPGSCTDGHGYWKTNTGTWNAGTNSLYTGQGILYTCSSNTWAAYYTPYTYPHPLASGDSPPAAPPLFRMHQR